MAAFRNSLPNSRRALPSAPPCNGRHAGGQRARAGPRPPARLPRPLSPLWVPALRTGAAIMSWADQGRSGYVPPHLRGAGERRRGGGGGGGGCPGALRASGRPWALGIASLAGHAPFAAGPSSPGRLNSRKRRPISRPLRTLPLPQCPALPLLLRRLVSALEGRVGSHGAWVHESARRRAGAGRAACRRPGRIQPCRTTGRSAMQPRRRPSSASSAGALEAGAPLGPSQALPWHQHSLKHTLQAARAAPVPLVASAAGRRRAAGAALGLQPPCSRARPRSGSHRTAWQ